MNEKSSTPTQGLCHPEGGTTEGSRSFAIAWMTNLNYFQSK